MNTIKCKYNWDEATVDILFSDGAEVALLCKGTLCICKSELKHLGERFALLTDLKDFRLTTACGEIEQTKEHITVTTMNSRYIFKIK